LINAKYWGKNQYSSLKIHLHLQNISLKVQELHFRFSLWCTTNISWAPLSLRSSEGQIIIIVTELFGLEEDKEMQLNSLDAYKV